MYCRIAVVSFIALVAASASTDVAGENQQPSSTSSPIQGVAMPPEHSDAFRPDIADIAYGPHERNVMDLYSAPGPGPHPLLLYIHGGGFKNGDKLHINRQLFRLCLERGISVVSISYRLSQHAIYPAPFNDCRLALQYIRYHAAELDIDPTRIAGSGSSAGAGMSTWLGFRPDMADPTSDDPVLRESTRLSAIVTTEGQTSYDPRFISRVVGGSAHTHRALAQLFGVPENIWPRLEPGNAALVEDGAAINFLTADDPPVFAIYKRENRTPTEEDDPNYGIHHPRFGYDLKTKMDDLGIPCVIHNDPRMEEDPDARKIAHTLAADFLAKALSP
ncbi:MAG: alpha/beta hydrolase [bacterium]|nr:alpha/beta hydrolase [bacterium]